MQNHKFKVENIDSGFRLDQFLVKHLPTKSRSQIKKFITDGNVILNSNPAKPHAKVKTADGIVVNIPPPETVQIKPQNIPIDIVYEDEDVVVVNKPAGMVVHPAEGNPDNTLVNALLYHCKNLAPSGLPQRPGVVHRIDKDVSGLLVVAKTEGAYNNLVKQFKERAIERKYVALVRGIVQLNEGIVDLPIGRHPANRKKMAVTYVSGKTAQTHYKVLKRLRDYTMVELTLKTGRTHQIRVHMASLGHPILGDATYGASMGLGRLALHAKTLGFSHPLTGKKLNFESPIPDEIKRLSD